MPSFIDIKADIEADNITNSELVAFIMEIGMVEGSFSSFGKFREMLDPFEKMLIFFA